MGQFQRPEAAAREAVKKEALCKAGIGCHEVVAGHTTPSELRAGGEVGGGQISILSPEFTA